jgi:hypothetical protein
MVLLVSLARTGDTSATGAANNNKLTNAQNAGLV